jgi:phosphoglycerol transferase MdoB-like AlkP superfamily enzyme
MVLFMLSRFHFYYVNSEIFGELSREEWVRIIIGGVRFDVVAVFYLNILYILAQNLPFARISWFQKILDILFVVTNSIGILLNCIDASYFPFNLKRITFTGLKELEGFNNGGDLFASFLLRYWTVWAVWLIFTIVLVVIVRKVKSNSRKYSVHSYLDAFIVTLLIVIGGVRGGDWRYSTRPISFNNAGEYIKSAQNAALVYSTPFSIFKSLDEKQLSKLTFFETEESLNAIFNPVQQIQVKEQFRKMNVVVLVLESFTEEASSISNTNPLTNHFTPFIDSLRRNSLFTEFSVANGKKSIEALPAIWGSIPSLEQPFVLTKFASNKVYGLPQILKDEGYHTSFFHGAPNGSMGFTALANLMGIDHYYGKNEFNNNSEFDGIWGIWDEPFLQYFGKKLGELPQPFFSTVFTLSSHDPFKVPQKYEKTLPEGPHPIFKTFSYSDSSLRAFFDKIKTEPWFNNTLFIISADHTGSMPSIPEFSNGLGKFRIPIFFYAPGLNIAKKSEKVFQQLDILPTVLHILQYNKPFVSFGKDLLDENSKDFAINKFENYQYIYKDYLMKLDASYKGVELFEFRKDIRLEHNIIAQNVDLASKIENEFKGFIQQFQNRMIEDRFTVK